MAQANPEVNGGRSIREVLTAGQRLFAAGLGDVFPWVLAAELLQLLPGVNTGGILDTDLSLFFNPVYLAKALILGGAQALLYAVAVARLARLAGTPREAMAWPVLRAMPAVFIGYIIYMLVVLLGCGLGALLFVIGMFLMGPLAGLVLSVIALGPTAAASTALAFFIYPAVLERQGPIAALNESSRLARGSWTRASLVVSVPALALLAAWLAGNGVEFTQSLSAALKQISNLQESMSSGQLQALLAGGADQAALKLEVQVAWGWRLLGAVAGAVAWWYTLTVCYAEFRDLKLRAAARAVGKKTH